MKKIKVLNLYAGIGGNRKLWKDVDVTAVEMNPDIAKIYQRFFPNDKVIVEDAHQYLLDHYDEFDLIWSSPPCQTHSVTNHFLKGQGIIRYLDLKLWQEIILLKTHCKSKWVVENVKPYYTPQFYYFESGRHYFWSNFNISKLKLEYDIGTMNRNASKSSQRKAIIREAQIPDLIDLHGLKDFKVKNKRQVLRNCVSCQVCWIYGGAISLTAQKNKIILYIRRIMRFIMEYVFAILFAVGFFLIEFGYNDFYSNFIKAFFIGFCLIYGVFRFMPRSKDLRKAISRSFLFSVIFLLGLLGLDYIFLKLFLWIFGNYFYNKFLILIFLQIIFLFLIIKFEIIEKIFNYCLECFKD